MGCYFGIKPFYYYQNDAGELLFGSEIKSFLAHPGFKKELNEEQLPLYLSYQYSPGYWILPRLAQYSSGVMRYWRSVTSATPT